MPKFTYEVRNEQDHLETGVMIGNSIDEVLDRLNQKKYLPISVKELNADGSKSGETLLQKGAAWLKRLQNQVPLKSVVFFTRQLATMIDGGVPISQALHQLAEDEKPVFKKIILAVDEDISMGKTLSDAMARHPGVFNNMYVAVVRAGETAGALGLVLDQMANYLENNEELRKKIKGAMRYPTFISGFVLLMVVIVLWKLVPIFSNVYASLNAELPLPTLILISVSDWAQGHIPKILAAAILLIVFFKIGLTYPSFRFQVERLVLKLPIYGIILQKNIWSTFSRTMALLLKSGTPILEAVEITSMVLNNSVFAQQLKGVYDKLRGGETLSKTLKESGRFSGLIVQLTATGERSGRVDELLGKAADFYLKEIKITVDSLATIIEPVLIVGLGGVVGSILIALYFPIFNLGKIIQ